MDVCVCVFCAPAKWRCSFWLSLYTSPKSLLPSDWRFGLVKGRRPIYPQSPKAQNPQPIQITSWGSPISGTSDELAWPGVRRRCRRGGSPCRCCAPGKPNPPSKGIESFPIGCGRVASKRFSLFCLAKNDTEPTLHKTPKRQPDPTVQPSSIPCFHLEMPGPSPRARRDEGFWPGASGISSIRGQSLGPPDLRG